MVSLNFTLVIELVLFVLFLWGTSRFILRPALTVIDEREDRIHGDHDAAGTTTARAEQVEAQYQKAIGLARMEAESAYHEEHMKLLDSYAARMTEARRAADEAVLSTRAQGEAALTESRAALKAAAPGLARTIAEKLALRGAGA